MVVSTKVANLIPIMSERI